VDWSWVWRRKKVVAVIFEKSGGNILIIWESFRDFCKDPNFGVCLWIINFIIHA
jgi:hypothetical protein